jgi:DegV family protein with EDD domain
MTTTNEATSPSKIAYLDGVRLHRAFVAGIREVIGRQDYLNKINVFPVPDRDTGTNMALTLNAIIEGTYSFCKPEINHLLDQVADSALNGARGNSGAILAQFFLGFSEGAKSVDRKMTTKNFVSAITTAVNYAHRALSQPQEGTILTVMRDLSDEFTRQQLNNDDLDFVELFSAGLKAAQTSLDGTVQQLKHLRKAGVVDAGAQGFVDFLTGIYEFMINGSIKDLNESSLQTIDIEIPAEELHLEIDEKYQFCTECLIHGNNIDQNTLREKLEELGNSLIVAGSSKKTKIHIHVNDPSKVFEICSEQGRVTGQKADDMIHQQKSFNHREGSVAILTDSTADFPDGMIADLDVHVVPLVINFGNKTFLDKVSITATEFYHELRRNKIHPKTSQPSFGDFHRQYQYLDSHYNSIISIHVPRASSGTIMASERAAEKCTEDNKTKINVLDSGSFSAGQGLIVRYAAEAAKAGLSHEEIVQCIEDIRGKTKAYAAISDLSYAARGGRVSEKLKKIVDLLHLTPVLGIKDEGKMGAIWMLFGRNNIAKKLVKKLKKQHPINKTYRVVVMHTNNLKGAKALQQAIKNDYPNLDSIDIVDCGAALGAHAGPGAVGVALQTYTPPTAQ